jgi:hypothetical protein
LAAGNRCSVHIQCLKCSATKLVKRSIRDLSRAVGREIPCIETQLDEVSDGFCVVHGVRVDDDLFTV